MSLADLRGRVVVLDFWTFACANCLHVIDELRPLEAKYPDRVVVVGVHSPKFAHEANHDALRAALERYEVRHPVLDDPDLDMWQQYAVRAWPTLVVIDPLGYVVATAAGEGQVSALTVIIDELIETHQARGTLRPVSPDRPARPGETAQLRFPAKAIVLPADRTGRPLDSLLVADAGHHRLAELDAGLTLSATVGSGVRGHLDGPGDSATFAEPNGLALLPAAVAEEVGFDVLVADTANHAIRGVRLADGSTRTVTDLRHTALSTITGPVPGVASPWDVAWWPAIGRAVVAAAGVHLLLGLDVHTGALGLLAGTTVEGLRDGPALDGWLAQPSGLAVDGERCWFVDAETSALRWLDTAGQLHTAVGEGLFDFGHVDGPAAGARLQHPLGVSVLDDGRVAVADTYNGAVRCYDPRTDQIATLVTGLDEPSGAVVLAGQLLVVESAAHRLRAVPTTVGHTKSGPVQRTVRPVLDIGAGEVTLRVLFTPAPGRMIDDRFGPATHLSVSCSVPSVLQAGTGQGTDLTRTLTLQPAEPARRTDADPPVADVVLQVSAQAASCDHDPSVAHPACYLARQDWGIPVRVTETGTAELTLTLLD